MLDIIVKTIVFAFFLISLMITYTENNEEARTFYLSSLILSAILLCWVFNTDQISYIQYGKKNVLIEKIEQENLKLKLTLERIEELQKELEE